MKAKERIIGFVRLVVVQPIPLLNLFSYEKKMWNGQRFWDFGDEMGDVLLTLI